MFVHILNMEYSLSDSDIRAFLGPVKICKYGEIMKYKSINELLAGDKCVVILYMTGNNYGHWTCLFKNHEGITYFDSYGKFIDDPLKLSTVKNKVGQHHTFLMKLLLDAPERIHYNDEKYQLLKDGVNTCGRHVVCRLRKAYLSNKQYSEYMDKHTDKRYTPDMFVVDEVDLY